MVVCSAQGDREHSRAEYNEQKEEENLRRCFEEIIKHDDKISLRDLTEQLAKLAYKPKRAEIEDMIWEVDEDCDKCVSWDEFKLMFARCRADKVRAARACSRVRGSHLDAPARRRGLSRASCSTWWSS